MEYEAYRFMAAAPESSSDHAGEDVAIYAVGPQSHFFRGIYQQNYIPHLMAYAACIGEGAHMCDANSKLYPTSYGICSMYWRGGAY